MSWYIDQGKIRLGQNGYLKYLLHELDNQISGHLQVLTKLQGFLHKLSNHMSGLDKQVVIFHGILVPAE